MPNASEATCNHNRWKEARVALLQSLFDPSAVDARAFAQAVQRAEEEALRESGDLASYDALLRSKVDRFLTHMRAKLLQPAAGIQSAQQPLAHPQQQMHAVLVPAYILPGAQLQQPLPMLPPSHTPLRQHAVHPVTHAQHPKQPCAPSGGGFDGRCHGGGYAGGCCGGGGVDDDNASSVSRKCSNGGGGLGGRDVISASSSAGRGSTALVAEYCRLVERLRAHLPLLRAQIAKYDKHAQRSSGEAGIKASRSRRILEEAHKRCTAEPGSAAAASYPITGTSVKLLQAVFGLLQPSSSAKAHAPVAAAAASAAAAPGVIAASVAPGAPPTAWPVTTAYPVRRAALVALNHNPSVAENSAETPHFLVCPISQDVMHDPVVAADGHTYERRLIEEWMRRGQQQGPAGAAGAGGGGPAPRSPMTNQPLPHTALVPNLALRSAIREWQEAQRRLKQCAHCRHIEV